MIMSKYLWTTVGGILFGAFLMADFLGKPLLPLEWVIIGGVCWLIGICFSLWRESKMESDIIQALEEAEEYERLAQSFMRAPRKMKKIN